MKKKYVAKHHEERLSTISTYLREYRINSGLTQNDLSRQLDLHRNTLIRAENGCNITLLSLFELADTLDISLKELFLEVD